MAQQTPEAYAGVTLGTTKVATSRRVSIYLAPLKSQAPTSLKPFRIDNPGGWGAFKWIGHHANDGRLEISQEGGEITYTDSADMENLFSERSPVRTSATFQSIDLTEQTFRLAFGASNIKKEGSDVIISGDPVSTSAMMLVVATGANTVAGALYYNVDLSGTMPTFPEEGPIRVPFSVAFKRDEEGRSMKWYAPVER